MSEEQEGKSSDELTNQKKSKNKGKGAQKAKQNYDKAKKRMETLKNVKAIAPLISALGMAFVVLIIILLIIGFIGFFTTLPSIAIEKFAEVCEGLWRWLTGNEEIRVDSDDINELANYIESLGYDLVGYGFVSPTTGLIERSDLKGDTEDEFKKDGKVKINDIPWNLNYEPEPLLLNLYAYIVANERTYTVQNAERGLFDKLFALLPGR